MQAILWMQLELAWKSLTTEELQPRQSLAPHYNNRCQAAAAAANTDTIAILAAWQDQNIHQAISTEPKCWHGRWRWPARAVSMAGQDNVAAYVW